MALFRAIILLRGNLYIPIQDINFSLWNIDIFNFPDAKSVEILSRIMEPVIKVYPVTGLVSAFTSLLYSYLSYS